MPIIIKDQPLRTRDPVPKLSDSEVITMEIVGSYLGLSQDRALFAYFQHHYAHFFPALERLHRSTFVRQAANLWALKERLWCLLRDEMISYDASLSMVDSVPIPVCRFARAPWCVRFRGVASSGKDHTDRQTFYGFRLHAQLSWPGSAHALFFGSSQRSGRRNGSRRASRHKRGRVGRSQLLASRSASVPAHQRDFLASTVSPCPLAPSAKAHHSKVLGRVRYLIDTVFGQLTDRGPLKRVWARDLWHLRNSLLRSILMHTICFFFNQQDQAPYLQFDRLVA